MARYIFNKENIYFKYLYLLNLNITIQLQVL